VAIDKLNIDVCGVPHIPIGTVSVGSSLLHVRGFVGGCGVAVVVVAMGERKVCLVPVVLERLHGTDGVRKHGCMGWLVVRDVTCSAKMVHVVVRDDRYCFFPRTSENMEKLQRQAELKHQISDQCTQESAFKSQPFSSVRAWKQ
jgi:hypothetical protein